MNVEPFGSGHAFVPSLIGLAMLALPSAASSQQQGQAQGQRQGEARVAEAPSDAQQPREQMVWNEVRVVRVKGDRIGEFEGLVKELVAAMSEQDAPGFNVYQVAFGEQNTYHIISEVESFAALADMAENPPMEPQEWATWMNRVESTIDSQKLMIAQMRPDVSVMRQTQAGAETPELMILVSQTLLPGKRADYEAWLRDEMVPALRQSDILGVFANEMAFGSDDRTWVFGVPIENLAALDEPMPLYRSMGQQAAEEMMSRGDSLVERSETIVLRTRPDLSTPGQLGQPQTSQQQQGQPQPAQQQQGQRLRLR